MSDRQEGSGWWLASDGKWYPPESHPSVRDQGGGDAGGTRYAGFWLRFWAWLIDAIIVGIGTGIITNVLNIDGGGLLIGGGEDRVFGAASYFDLAASWLYFSLMESSATQATLGKMALNLKVTDIDGARITFGRATGRHFAKFLSAIILLVGFMMAGWTARKQALHDMIANTLVVRS